MGEPDERAPKPRRRWLRTLVLVVAAGLLGYGVGWAQPLVLRPPLVVGQDAITDTGSGAISAGIEDAGGRVLVIRPRAEATKLLVLYPGGLVRPQAYEWLGRALAERGVLTVIPEFTADLAVIDKDRATVLLDRYGAGKPAVIAGHSLGGAMAADYAARHQDRLAGLILMAAYPPDGVELSGGRLRALSLLAEHDGVADPAKVRGGMAHLAPASALVVVPGAVHAFFGRYGPQSGDGQPTVDRSTAERFIIRTVGDYLDGVG